MRHNRHSLLLGGVLAVLALAGCAKKSVAPPDVNADIPADPGGAAPATRLDNVHPYGTFSRTSGNEVRIRLNLLGVADPVTGLPLNLGTGEIFVTEDGVLQGRKVSVPVQQNRLKADVVFVVDNSGSMGEEADSIASRISAFAHSLESRNIDVRVGCVGHGYNSDQHVYGALDLTDANALGRYLAHDVGLARTVGFAGSDSAALDAAALSFGSDGGGENSIIGIRFADAQFRWRPDANRIYVAFTDEPTQPGGDSTLSTRVFAREWRSGAGRGTVHVVYSADTTGYWADDWMERPWTLAQETGGTFKIVQWNASDLNLETLPVTGVIAASRLVEFVTAAPDGLHNVVVTVKTPNADGRTLFQNIRYGAAATRTAVLRPSSRRPMVMNVHGHPAPGIRDE
jgi:hypothetical protein